MGFVLFLRHRPMFAFALAVLLLLVFAAVFAPVSYTHLDVYKRQYLPLSIERNIALGNLRSKPLWSIAHRDRTGVTNLMKAMNVAARSADQPVGALSGGNQQKVMTVSYTHLDVYKRQYLL